MPSLTFCSSFGDVVWFVVGNQHILRVLVQSSEGTSLVSFARYWAKVIIYPHLPSCYIMAKCACSPKSLKKSVAQWDALVKVCSGVLCYTTLGLRVDQMLELGGYDAGSAVFEGAGHPQDLAVVLVAIGSIAACRLLKVTVIGGPLCTWVAAVADFVFGLRVVLRE